MKRSTVILMVGLGVVVAGAVALLVMQTTQPDNQKPVQTQAKNEIEQRYAECVKYNEDLYNHDVADLGRADSETGNSYESRKAELDQWFAGKIDNCRDSRDASLRTLEEQEE